MILSHELAKDFGIAHRSLLRSIHSVMDSHVFDAAEVYLTEYTTSQNKKSPTYTLSKTAVVYMLMTFRCFRSSAARVTLCSKLLGELGVTHNIVLSDATPKEMKFHAMLREFFPEFEIIHQFPIGKYRIDFYLPASSLAIEFDEHHHKTPANQEKDAVRVREIADIRGNEADHNINIKWVRVKEGEEIRGLRNIADTLYEESKYFTLPHAQ